MENEKDYKLKSVNTELKKARRALEKKQQRMQELSLAIKADTKRIKELESISKRLDQEELQQQVNEVWFREQKLSHKQIRLYLELSRRFGSRIEGVDLDKAERLLMECCSDQKPVSDSVAPHTEPTEQATGSSDTEKKGVI